MLARRLLKMGAFNGGGFTPSDVPQSEADALIALYNATGGDSWTNNTGWKTDPVVDNWHGITVAGGHVTQIDINTNNVVGEWTAAMLTPLTALEQLRGYNNASLDCSFTLSDLPAGMTYLHLASTGSTITGALSDLPAGMTYLHLGGTSSTITGALSDLPAGMTYLHLASTGSTITGALSDLPAGMANLYLYSTGSTITGPLADLPASMTTLYLYSTGSTITGPLADLPAGITYLYLYSTGSTITGGAAPMAATGIRDIRIQNIGLDQTEVDGILERLYTDWASFTFATPSLNIGANDATPSGIYQDGDPPTTGLEYVYELANDPETTGNHAWSIVYNGGTAP